LEETCSVGNEPPHLEFRILGPLELRLDGLSVPVGGPRQRALLALLLCNANQVVSRDRLIDELLGDHAADSAERMLRVQVSRLRKVLAAAGDSESRLIARPPGYVLRVEAGELDLRAFEQQVMEGRRALEADDPRQAATRLHAAESLWRGRPLADLEFHEFARFEIQRLDELRLEAAEERIAAEIALGLHASLCSELETLVADHPLRERLRGQLMLVLYRSGRQTEALAAYRAGHSLLAEELALEPSPELKQLERAILRHDAALQWRRVAPAGASHDSKPLESDSEPRPNVERRPRRRWAALVLGIAVVATSVAALIIATASGSSGQRGFPLRANVLALVSSGAAAVRATVPLPAPPTAVVTGFGSLWVAEAGSGVVVRVDPRRRAEIAAIPVGTRSTRVVVAAGRVWVLDPAGGTVSAIDPNSGTVAQAVAVGRDPSDIAVSGRSLWLADHGDNTVVRVDPGTGRVHSVVRTERGPVGLAAAGASIWVADDGSGAVQRIDARTGAVRATIRVGGAPAAIVATAAAVWVLDPIDATLSRIDPRRDAVVATVPLGGAPTTLEQSDGYLWVGDARHGTLQRLDPRRGTITNTLRIGAGVSALGFAGGLWLAVDRPPSSHRGGTLASIASYAAIDTIDPAASSSPNVAPPQLFGLTNDGLVTLDHVGGGNGTRLVPDLALSLPTPTGNRRIYAFQIRPGIRYSTGGLVEPSDVTHSFERLFEIGSSGAAYYEAIAGTRACRHASTGCDLARGIVADDPTRTVTFHLTRPDPDFLYKLTLAYADVLPTSTPSREARTPLPATGPYMIARYVPRQTLRLVRNPRFREWSAAAQPDGYPDQIVIPLDLSGAQGAASIADGQDDFMPNIGRIPGREAVYFLRSDRRQVRINPFMATGFMFLNVNAAPFNDPRVRRAVNLALDRRRIVAGYGGASAATPTCQILPPHLPGYRRYCPYTRDPEPNGRWRGPDLARARRLVAASRTRGMKVTVWDTPAPQVTIAESQDTVATLRRLGYRASLRVLPDSTYFTYINDSRNHAQVIDSGWSADYPSANDFIGKLTCNYFTPGNGLDTTDAASSATTRSTAKSRGRRPCK
jgi:YVTN family beta-propeller protein